MDFAIHRRRAFSILEHVLQRQRGLTGYRTGYHRLILNDGEGFTIVHQLRLFFKFPGDGSGDRRFDEERLSRPCEQFTAIAQPNSARP